MKKRVTKMNDAVAVQEVQPAGNLQRYATAPERYKTHCSPKSSDKKQTGACCIQFPVSLTAPAQISKCKGRIQDESCALIHKHIKEVKSLNI